MSSMISSNIEGFEGLEKYFRELGEGRFITMAEKQAVDEATPIVLEAMKEVLDSEDYRYQGFSFEDIEQGKTVKTRKGVRGKIGWNGSHERYRIMMFNEYGFRHYLKKDDDNPRVEKNMGKMFNARQRVAPEFEAKVKEVLLKELKLND